jgi:beta-galactosidase
VPEANQMVNFNFSGPGSIIGLNNGDPTCHEPEKGVQHSVFHGLAQVILQSVLNGYGSLTLRATADGLTPAEVMIDVKAVKAIPALPKAEPTLVVSRWRMSPIFAQRPDPNQPVSDTDMNTWGSVQAGRLTPFNGGSFAVFRAEFKPRAMVIQNGGKLTLRDVTGKAQVWLNGKLLVEKSEASRGTITAPFPPGLTDVTLNVLIETTPGSRAGLGGPVTVE